MIQLIGAAKRFGDLVALHPLRLHVGAGEVVALIGPNGAGKSTALRILAGIVRPTEGSGSIAGLDVVRQAAKARRHLGYLPQKLGVPPTTGVAELADLVAAVRWVPAADARAALEAAGLGDRLDATVGQLSGGQRQRLMLALATLPGVAALILDEPAISLDSEAAEEVRDVILNARARGVAVLFASHHLADVAALADRIVVVVDGKAVAQGSVAELAAAAGVPWSDAVVEPPMERIYRVLVARGRGQLRLVEGEAA